MPSADWSSTSTSRCWATATSGRRPTRCGWSSRPVRRCGRRARLPGPAVAVPRPGRGLRRVSRVATLPDLGQVAAMMRRHAELLVQHLGEERGCIEFRKHVSWYLKGFAAGGELRRELAMISSLAELDERWPGWTRPSRSRSPSWAPPGGGRARRVTRWPCPSTGSRTPTGPAAASPRTRRRRPAAEIPVTRLTHSTLEFTLTGVPRRDLGHGNIVVRDWLPLQPCG